MRDIKISSTRALWAGSAVGAWAALAALAAPAGASLINETVGGNAVVFDSSMDLQWLDAPATLGMSPDAAISAFPGYSLATIGQVDSLLESAGIPSAGLPAVAESSDTDDYGSYNPGQMLYSTIGFTYFPYAVFAAPNWEQESWGNYQDGAGTGWDQVFIDARSTWISSPGTNMVFDPMQDSMDTSSAQNFDLLVQSVPEPSVLGFVGLLLAATAIRRKRFSSRPA